MTKVPKDVILDLLKFVTQMKNENSSTSYISIKNAFNLFSIPIPVIIIPAGTKLKLFRIRIHEKPNILYSEIQELGHRLDRNGINGFGRANEPLQSIFYCSDVRETAFCETSKLVREKIKGLIEENTVGIWKLNRDIRVARLPKDKDYENNKTVKSLNKDFNDFVDKHKTDDLLNLQYFWHKISDEFSEEESSPNFNYLITAAFANYIYDTPMAPMESKENIDIDGITYPSVQWKLKGMNFALKPELVENKDIELEKAIYSKMQLVTEDRYEETMNIVSKKIDYANYTIRWNNE